MPNASSSPGPLPSTQHIDALYRLAHVLVGKERASDLVVETYQRATHLPSGPDAPADSTHAGDIAADRLTLMRLMREAYADFKQAPAYPGSEDDDGHATSYRRQTALRVVEQRLPLALALLGRDERLILTLRDAQGLSTDEVASVMDQSPSHTNTRLEEARHALYEALRDVATPGEQQLFRDNLRESDIHASLQSMDTLGSIAVPTVLRARVAQVLKASASGAQGPGAMQTPLFKRTATLDSPGSTSPSSGSFSASDSADPSTPDASEGASALPSTQRASGTTTRRSRSPRDRRTERSSTWGRRVRQFVVATILIVATAAAGYFISELVDPAPEPDLNLIAVSARRAGAVPILLDTRSRDEAVRFVQAELSRQVEVPRIENAALSGVGIFNIRDNVRVPVFVFDDSTNEQRLTVYAYSYATLDQLDGQMELAEGVRAKLQEEEAITLERTADGNALVWRQRDDIYVAVTYADPEALRPRIGHSM